MDITFWVIQAVLLTPVLFLAASVGMEDQPGRSRRTTLTPEPDRPGLPQAQPRTRPVAVALAGLSQFTAEQQARLVVLRSFVQEARLGRGTLSDDMVAATDLEGSPDVKTRPGRGRSQLSTQLLLLAGGVVLIVAGVVGIARTSIAMDDLQRTTTSRIEPLTFSARFLPGVIVNPSKYLSAVNGSSGVGGSSGVDPLYQLRMMEQKQAMDRWEALAGIGLSLLLFVNAMRAAQASRSGAEEGSMAVDFAPFLLVAAVLFGALSFFELP